MIDLPSGKMNLSTCGLISSSLDVRLAFERDDLDLGIEVADVADDGLSLHRFHVFVGENVAVAVHVTKMSPCGAASSMVRTW
jgi:hypothetical protein